MTTTQALLYKLRRIKQAYKKYRYEYPELARMCKRNIQAIEKQLTIAMHKESS